MHYPKPSTVLDRSAISTFHMLAVQVTDQNLLSYRAVDQTQNTEMIMHNNSYSISEAFGNYITLYKPQNPVADIVEFLANNDLSRIQFKKVCSKLRVQPSFYKDELLDLVMFYIRFCLEDHVLTSDEMLNIQHLKLLFRVKNDDFYKLKLDQVRELLEIELAIFLKDKSIDHAEASHQSDLQRIFDLSYDQYLQLTMKPIEDIVESLIARIIADGIVTEAERKELLQQIIALDTVYNLSPAQKSLICGVHSLEANKTGDKAK